MISRSRDIPPVFRHQAEFSLSPTIKF